MSDAKTYKCGCGCGDDRCVVCDGFDCKWPGECAGKCVECGGGPIRELINVPLLDGTSTCVSEGCSFCSNECYAINHARAVAEGRIIKIEDLSDDAARAVVDALGAGDGRVNWPAGS